MSKGKRKLLYYFWSAAIMICIVLVFFMLIFTSCSKKEGNASITDPPVTASDNAGNNGEAEPVGGLEGQEPAPGTEETPTAISTTLGETEDMGQAYVDKMVFLGDSTTYGLKFYGVLTGGKDTTQVWTPSSGTLTLSYQSIATVVYPETGEEIKIVDAVTAKKPEYMVITLGVNGVSFMEEEYFTSEYTKLVKSIQEASPETKIILNSIYPVSASYKNLDTISNEKITAANGWIKGIADSLDVRYLDSASAIVGADGFLPEEYQNGDGIHLNEEGFKLILNYLKTHGYK